MLKSKEWKGTPLWKISRAYSGGGAVGKFLPKTTVCQDEVSEERTVDKTKG